MENLRILQAFYLTGQRTGGLETLKGKNLSPAALAPYQDYSTLRNDYPIVLSKGGGFPLWQIMDRLVEESRGGETCQNLAWAMEDEMRRGASQIGEMGALWDQAEKEVSRGLGKDDYAILMRLRQGRPQGDIVASQSEIGLVLSHLAMEAQRKRESEVKERLQPLSEGVWKILKADEMGSLEARSAQRLEGMVGTKHQGAFDLQTLSAVLSPSATESMDPKRKRRLKRTLNRLNADYPFAPAPYCVGTVSEGREMIRSLCKEVISLAKAVHLAALETTHSSRPHHDAYFKNFNLSSLSAEDWLFFPQVVVMIDAEDLSPKEESILWDLLDSPFPVRIFLQTHDPLEPLSKTLERSSVMSLSKRAATGESFVLQTPASHLPRMSETLQRGMTYKGPSLFTVLVGNGEHSSLDGETQSRAAWEARLFPIFSSDPSKKGGMADQFSVENNPALDAPWAIHTVSFEDTELQRGEEEHAFTPLDIAACDNRWTDRFAVVPPDMWTDEMAPAGDRLSQEPGGILPIPYLLMVDGEGVLHRVVPEQTLIRETRNWHKGWIRLAQWGGINNSYSLLARREAKGEGGEESCFPSLDDEGKGGRVDTEVASLDRAPLPPSGPHLVPTIDTARCSTCDECIKLNKRMFVYNANKKAEIGDLEAGTFREMVEAAEVCKVAVIHPGNPWNPDEPGLEALKERAAPFN